MGLDVLTSLLREIGHKKDPETTAQREVELINLANRWHQENIQYRGEKKVELEAAMSRLTKQYSEGKLSHDEFGTAWSNLKIELDLLERTERWEEEKVEVVDWL